MRDEIDLYLGRRLRRRRRLMGLTQEELGAACGVRFQQIQKYECAANKMSAAMLGRLAIALDTGVAYFYDGIEDVISPRSSRSDGAARKDPDEHGRTSTGAN